MAYKESLDAVLATICRNFCQISGRNAILRRHSLPSFFLTSTQLPIASTMTAITKIETLQQAL
jgi:hypothetical protein